MDTLIAGHSQLKGVRELLLNHPTVSVSCHPGRRTEELFALVEEVLPSCESILAYAESGGHSEIAEEVAAVLSEDVVYRLREVIQNTCQHMLHARRKKMTCSDFNVALRNMDVQPVFGCGGAEPVKYRHVADGGGDLHFVDDTEVDLAGVASDPQPTPARGITTLHAQWLVVEGVPAKAKPGSQSERAVSADLLSYYEQVTRAILSSDDQLMMLALTDLRTNPKISPILPYFINFISNGVKTVSHDVGQVTRLLHTVRALVSNRSLYFEPKPYLELLVQALLHCITEPLSAPVQPLSDHWAVRDYAARLLTGVVRTFETAVNPLRGAQLESLQGVLYDLGRPFCSHYGAVVALAAFGIQATEQVILPHLSTYWPHLQTAMQRSDLLSAQTKADAFHVYAAILLAAGSVVMARSTLLLGESDATEDTCRRDNVAPISDVTTDGTLVSPEATPVLPPSPSDRASSPVAGGAPECPLQAAALRRQTAVYAQLSAYFGDALTPRLPVTSGVGAYHRRAGRRCPPPPPPAWPHPTVTFTDEHSHKSGDQLLQEFLAAPECPPAHHPPCPAPELADADESCDEKSERSSRSSRSERSHSDESLGYLDDADLTVKATVSDPTFGIKLTIAKRPKVRATPPPVGDGAPGCRRRHWGAGERATVFAGGPGPLPPLGGDRVTTAFCLDGREERKASGAHGVGHWRRRGATATGVKSEYRRLCARAACVGRRRAARRDVSPPPAHRTLVSGLHTVL